MPPQEQYKGLLERARKRFAQAVEAETDIRKEALQDLLFLSGDQWDERVKHDRENGPSPRPCLVFNKVLPPVTQLGNQARQNKPAIKVSPVDSAGDPETAKVLQGMVRHIEYDSDADQAYDTALFYAAGCSFGFWMYGCEESDPLSFNQDLKTITIDDPFSIYVDCYARKPDRSDMKWAFRLAKLSNEAHEDRFGKDQADLSADFLRELTQEGWLDDDGKRVAEYWEITTVKKTLRMRKDADGTVHPVYLEDLEEGEEEGLEWELGKDGKPRESTKEIPTVMQYIINGAAVLEEPAEWDGTTIPIVMVTGLEMTVRGKKKIFSMTRFARDPQQLLNYYKTMEAETISLAPKPKWVGGLGQFKSKRKDWQRANTDNAAFLEYDPVAVGDKLLGPPRWEVFDPPVQALAIGAAAAADDIKDSTGYADAQLGKNPRDQSGIAIQRLQAKGDISNFHFMDNLARALKRGGRILVELIPKKYDTAREVRVIGDDKKQNIVMVNAPYVDAETGKPQHHKLDQGKYDVTVSQGISYDSQRSETRELLMSLAQGNPEIWSLAADVFFENSDFVGADRLAKRFHSALPPAMLQAEEGDPEIPPQLQSQMAQQKAQIDQLTEANQQLISMVKQRLVEAQAKAESAEKINREKVESAERIANENNRARIQAAETLSKAGSMNVLAKLDHDAVAHQLDLRHELLHASISVEQDAAGAEQDRQHEQQMQAQDQAHQQGMAAADQEHQADQATQDREASAAQQDSAQEATAAQATQAQVAAIQAAKAKPTATPKGQAPK
jgi:hypothetical protein